MIKKITSLVAIFLTLNFVSYAQVKTEQLIATWTFQQLESTEKADESGLKLMKGLFEKMQLHLDKQ